MPPTDSPPPTLDRAVVDCIGKSTLANTFIQLAVHFPQELTELDLSVDEALEQALRLSEEAIELAPHRAEGLTALARTLMMSVDPGALDDAISLLRAALQRDPEFDPAEVALATALREKGETEAAMDAVDRVLKRGNSMPQSLLLKALLLSDQGTPEDARRAIERAARIAPNAGLLQLDAARICEDNGDNESALEYRHRAQDLLGDAYDEIVALVSAPTALTPPPKPL